MPPPLLSIKLKIRCTRSGLKEKKCSRATELISDIRCDEIPAESVPSKTPEHLKRGRRPDSYEATVSPENEASRRVLEKCDFHAAQSGLSASGPLLTISQSLAQNPEGFLENFRSLYEKNREGVPPLEKG